MVITEDYVSFETAKLLKEKGFNKKCPCSYRKKLVDSKIVDDEELFMSAHLMLTNNELEDKSYRDIVYCSAPTLQMVMKWLREAYRLDIDISIEYIPKKVYYYAILKKTAIRNIDCLHSETNFKSYEEATEAAIKYCLENLI